MLKTLQHGNGNQVINEICSIVQAVTTACETRSIKKLKSRKVKSSSLGLVTHNEKSKQKYAYAQVCAKLDVDQS